MIVDLSSESTCECEAPFSKVVCPVFIRVTGGQASFDGDNFLTSKLSADDSAEALFDSPGGPPLASAVSNGGTGNQESASVRLQKDFVSTALFQTVVSEKGVARVNFTAPDNLGTFIVRAYAASGMCCAG